MNNTHTPCDDPIFKIKNPALNQVDTDKTAYSRFEPAPSQGRLSTQNVQRLEAGDHDRHPVFPADGYVFLEAHHHAHVAGREKRLRQRLAQYGGVPALTKPQSR